MQAHTTRCLAYTSIHRILFPFSVIKKKIRKRVEQVAVSLPCNLQSKMRLLQRVRQPSQSHTGQGRTKKSGLSTLDQLFCIVTLFPTYVKKTKHIPTERNVCHKKKQGPPTNSQTLSRDMHHVWMPRNLFLCFVF